MYKVKEKTLKEALKPFDVVKDKKSGAVGFICEVSVNDCQPLPEHQISYAVQWMTPGTTRRYWWNYVELEYQSNLMHLIGIQMCNPMGRSDIWVKELLRGRG